MPIDDVPEVLPAHRVIRQQLAICLAILKSFANFSHLILREFCLKVRYSFEPCMSALRRQFGSGAVAPTLIQSIMHIFKLRTEPQMSGPETRGIVSCRAVMQYLHVIWNRAIHCLPSQTMNHPRSALMLDNSVTAALFRERPNQTGIALRNAVQHVKEDVIGGNLVWWRRHLRALLRLICLGPASLKRCGAFAIVAILSVVVGTPQQIELTNSKNVKGVLPRKNGGLGVGAINSYGGSVASASSLTVACNQSLTVTGATAIQTITMAAPTGCAAILIAGAGATWSTGTSGNISSVISPAVGSAAILLSDGTKFNPGLGGANGTNGHSILSGSGAPAGGTGVDGDFYLDTAATTLYGPKSGGVWPSGVSLIGPPGTFPVVLGPTQFLQGTPNVSPQTYRAANLPYLLSSDYDYPFQTPGGSLTISVPATVIMTPCPLGLAGTVTNTYERLVGGTGPDEAVLITGGTCTSGGTTGTVTFIPGGSHSGAWTIRSATAGIKEALNSLPADGGQVWMPSGPINIYGTIVLGDGTATLKSTRNSMALVGRGSGRGVDIAFPADGATTLLWAGASGATMMKVAGPVGNGTISDFMLDGQGVAAIGLDIIHSYSWLYRRLTVVGWSSIGMRTMATDFVFSGMVTGNNNNLFDSLIISAGTGDSASVACQFGQPVFNTFSIFDTASNMMMNSTCRSDAGLGTELRFADNNSWYQSSVGKLKFTKVAAGFPGANVFYQSPQGLVTASADLDLTTTNTNLFFPFSSTDTVQDPRTVIKFASGIDTTGSWFGIQKYVPLHYSQTTIPPPIASTAVETAFASHYLIPKYTLNYLGAKGIIKASGRVSSTGTPTLTFIVKIGGVPVGKFTFTVGSGVTNDAFAFTNEFTVGAIGAGDAVVGYSAGMMGGFSGATTSQASRVVGLQGITWTVDNDMTLTATWNASSASNTVTLDTFTLDVEFPGQIQ